MRKPLNHALALALLTGSCAWAQSSTVPAAFQSTYGELQASIGSFQATVSASWNGKSSNVLWSSEVLAANADNGLPVLNNSANALAQINMYKAMGARAVTVNMAFPIVTQDYYTFNGDPQDYASMVAFYANLATQIHQLGLKMIVEAALVYPGLSGMNVAAYYASLTDAQFIAERANNALTIAQQVGPDYINLNSEPDTDLINSGGKTNEYGSASGYVAMNRANISTLRSAGVKTPLGVGIGSWLHGNSGGAGAWVAALVSIPGLSFFDIHVYPVIDNFLQYLITYTSQAQAAGLPVGIAQTWVNKESSAEWAEQAPQSAVTTP
jgi:hypothetical protein